MRDLGMLSTEDHRIRKFREKAKTTIVNELALSSSDILGVSYAYRHFIMSKDDKNFAEIWIGDNYLNPENIIWVEHNENVYGVLNDEYPDYDSVSCYINRSILKRESFKFTDGIIHTPSVIVDAVDEPRLTRPYQSAYAIADNKIVHCTVVPQPNGTTFQYIANYDFPATYVDIFVCSNLVSITDITADVSTFIDNQYSERCYYGIFVDNDPSYPIDSRFYPRIKVDKDCVVRVFNDAYHTLYDPSSCRIVNTDGYNNFDTEIYDTSMEEFPPVDDEILPGDSISEMLTKIRNITKYCCSIYKSFEGEDDPSKRMIKSRPSDFYVCSDRSTYILQTNGIYTTFPAEPNRDLIFYDGRIYDGEVRKVLRPQIFTNPYVPEDQITSSVNPGVLVYLFPHPENGQLYLDKLTVVKFNTAEDSAVINISDYVDKEMVLHLHNKLNRFYNNLLILRGVVDNDDGLARVATVQPTARDNYLWFELLTNVDSDIFGERSIDMIHMFGLDSSNIPENILAGAYAIDLEPDAGPEEYTDLIMTYFGLDESKRNYLALQYGNPELEGSEVQVVYNLTPDEERELDDVVDQLTNEERDITFYSEVVGHDVSLNSIYDLPIIDKELVIKAMVINDNNDDLSYLHNIDNAVLSVVLYKMLLEAHKHHIVHFTENDNINGNEAELTFTPTELAEMIEDAVTNDLREFGTNQTPTDAVVNTLGLDYGANSTDSELGDLFQQSIDETLYRTIAANVVDVNDLNPGDIWYEFIKDIDTKVVYCDTSTLVMRMEDDLLSIEFDTEDNISAYVFDDIFFTFKDNKSVKYNSLVADLINSKVIDYNDINIFHGRLVTDGDKVNIGLKRLYTERSNIVSMLESDVPTSVLYSRNILREHLDYRSAPMNVRELLFSKCIKMPSAFSFINNKMMLFVNGRYIHPWMIRERGSNCLFIGEEFDEMIKMVDILYSANDYDIIQIKRAAISHPYEDKIIPPTPIITPDKYKDMVPIIDNRLSKNCYYDVLLNEYVFNGKLDRALEYLAENPEEFEDFKTNLVSSFSAISESILFHSNYDNPRIIIKV